MNISRFTTLAPDRPFLDELAVMLLERANGDPLALAQALVLLPSRRACRNLQEAFLRASGGKPLLMPRILPIGEVDGEADLAAMAPLAPAPEISGIARTALLTRLVRESGQSHPARALSLASELSKLMDDVTRHGLTFDGLSKLAPENLSEHWQKTTEFLGIVSRAWPMILEAEGMTDPVFAQRERMLSLAAAWRKSPPAFPVIAAGSTGSIPATAELLISISRMPQGVVILPGLDRSMDDAMWEALEPTHPQFTMKKLLARAEVERSAVESLSASAGNAALSAVFAPAMFTAGWRHAGINLAQLSHIRFMESRHPA